MNQPPEKKSGRGGFRPGAGRKPKPVQKIEVKPLPEPEKEPEIVPVSLEHRDPKAFLMALMNDFEADIKVRADAAKALMPFVHQKLGEGGKKEQRQKDAEKVAGRFSAGVPPRLVAAGGRKV